jgi:hypothetical protein
MPRPVCSETDFTAEMIGTAFQRRKTTSPGLGLELELELQDQRKSLRRDCLPSHGDLHIERQVSTNAGRSQDGGTVVARLWRPRNGLR